MSGDLMINRTDNAIAFLNLKSNHGTVGVIPTSDSVVGSVRVVDNNDETMEYFRGVTLKTTGETSMEMVARRTVSDSSTFNTLALRIAADGTRSVSVSQIAPWLEALGLTNLLQSKQYTYAYTIAASNRLDITVSNFNISTPSGYAPFGFSYINTGSQHVFLVTISPNATASSSNILTLKNTATSTITGTATIRVLYIKTSFYGALN